MYGWYQLQQCRWKTKLELRKEVVSLGTLLNPSKKSVLIPFLTQAIPALTSVKWHFYHKVSTFTLGYQDTVMGTSERTNTIAAITIQLFPVGNWGIIWIENGRNIEKMDIF